MVLSKATAEDDESLKTFLASKAVNGLFDYKVVRTHSFFDQYGLTTDDHHTFTLKDDQGQIHAMASILFRVGYLNDQEQVVGYLTDLRVSPSRQATLSWSKEFVPIFEQLRDERQCRVLFSDLELFESKAYNLLLRRRQIKHPLPRYHLFRKFNLIGIYGRHLFADTPLSSIKISQGTPEDIPDICNYLREKSVRRPLRYNLTDIELEKRVTSWPSFSIHNFLLARSKTGEMIGCMAPWDNSQVQQHMVKKYHGKSFQVFSTSRTLSLLGMTRALPLPGQPLRVKHLTHSAYDNPDIFYSLLYHAYNQCEQKQILVYPNYDGDFVTRPPKSFLSVKIPYGLYSVLDHDQKLASYLHPNPFTPAPDFTYSYF
jgi:hypothetical protein